MNTYNDNLQSTVAGTLGQMQAQLKALQSANTAAEYTLYFAQSANITANEKLQKVTTDSATVALMNAQGVENDNLAANLLATVQKASATVATSVTNASTTASNVQVAATAIAQLASDIGSAFNLVSAEDNNTDVFRMTATANRMIRETAYKAEYISQLAMEASEQTAEIQTAQLLAETTEVKAGIENLMGVTEAEFTNLTSAKTGDVSAVDATSSTEQQAEGVLLDAQTEYNAISNAYAWTRVQLNYGLRVVAFTNSQVTVAFEPFVQPFQVGDERLASQIPPADPSYYLLVVPAKSADLISIEKAELLFADYREQRFYPVLPTADGVAVPLEYDSDGAMIKQGNSYVVFLYIALAQEYKRYINDFEDVLSAPSDPFTLAVPLAAATNFSLLKPPAPAKGQPPPPATLPVTLQFTVAAPLLPRVEYRFMLLPLETKRSREFMTAASDARLDFYFNQDIAEQISPANYILAKLVPPPATPSKEPATAIGWQVTIDQGTTDNFGNQLEPGRYIPVVQSFAQESVSSSYINTLSDIDSAPVFTINERSEVSLTSANSN